MSADEENKILTALNNLHVEMEKRFTALETLQQEQRPRCNAHATAIKELAVRATSLEDTRTFVKGILAFVTKLAVVAAGISAIVFSWLGYIGPHADKPVK